jgi:divalent metal cation (Fe/Co/Zn/Cd) transporter
MDALAGVIGAGVIASLGLSLVRDTGRILLDMDPDPHLSERLRREIETDGDKLTDLHPRGSGPAIWRR